MDGGPAAVINNLDAAQALEAGTLVRSRAGYGWGSSPADRLTDVIGDAGEFEAEYVVSRFRLLFGFELGVK